MKKILYLYTFACSLLLLNSCSKDFLKEASLDLVRPTTTEALSQLLTGEAYPSDGNQTGGFHPYLELMTDDVQANYTNDALYISRFSLNAPAFTWHADLLDQLQQIKSNGYLTYSNYYQKIKGCNVVLDYIDQVTGSAADKRNLKGQALAIRAYLYFMLTNLFGKPYNQPGTNINTDLGVPLILSAVVTSEIRPRATLKEVYDQIEKDITEAVTLLPNPNTTNSVYRFTNTAAAIFASRFFLYKNDWDKAIQYADLALTKAPALVDLNSVTATSFSVLSPLIAGNEVSFAFGTTGDYNLVGTAPNSNGMAPYTLSADLVNLYGNDDLRKTFYLAKALYISGALIVYYSTSAKAAGIVSQKALRTSEAYLNRAEAYIQKALQGDAAAVTKALSDLNDVRRKRITVASYQDLTITDPAQLFAVYKNERRKELFFEDHRWFDLRRWGMPQLTHTYQVDAVVQTAILEQGDSRYTLRFPQEVLFRNPALAQNP